MQNSKTNNRIKSIDSFRGFAIISMLIVNYLALYPSIPNFFKHAKNNSLTFADMIAPFFIFAIGITYQISFKSRLKASDRITTYKHFILRYFIIMLIGIFSVMISNLSLTFKWGVLQAIGASGLIALLFIEIKIHVRIIVIIILAALYQFCITPSFENNILSGRHGGVLGVLSWTIGLLLAIDFGKYLFDKPTIIQKNFLHSVFILILGIIFSLKVPINKNLVSISYIFISIGITGLVFEIFIILSDILNIYLITIEEMGKNALLLFLLHNILVKIGHVFFGSVSSMILILIWLTFSICICALTGIALDRKKLYLKI